MNQLKGLIKEDLIKTAVPIVHDSRELQELIAGYLKKNDFALAIGLEISRMIDNTALVGLGVIGVIADMIPEPDSSHQQT